MRIEVNGVRLFFDVEGAKLVPDGPVMREKPTLLLLHGGPGVDHSGFRPAFSPLADACQVIYLDLRGNGRSDREPRTAWNLAQWGDDVYEFCRALEIEKPVVFGISFGGFVAMSYATRHPEHPGKLILMSTLAKAGAFAEQSVAKFEQLGGPEIGDLARRVLLGGMTSQELYAEWNTKAGRYYSRRPRSDPDGAARIVRTAKVGLQWAAPGAEGQTFDMRTQLRSISCPTLVVGGIDDPMTPIEAAEEIASLIPAPFVRLERIEDAGHSVYRDAPRVLDLIREFILA